MKSLGRACLLFLFVVVCTLMMVSQSQAKVSSHKINAKGVGQFNSGDGTAVTKIIGGGLLHGTSEGTSEVVGGAFPVFSVAGFSTITTNKGTLTFDFEGVVDLSTGEYLFSGPVRGGTGKLEGAIGTITLEGVQDETGMFVEDMTGTIYVDLSPKR